jgi:hypothetical protein
MTSLAKALDCFAQFAARFQGEEKGEAQTFLFHLLAAFGHDASTLPEGSNTGFDTFPRPQFDNVARASSPAGSGGVLAPRTLGSTYVASLSAERGRTADPQAGTPALPKSRAVAEAAVALLALRREIMQANGWSLRDPYRTLETPSADRLRDAHAPSTTAPAPPMA